MTEEWKQEMLSYTNFCHSFTYIYLCGEEAYVPRHTCRDPRKICRSHLFLSTLCDSIIEPRSLGLGGEHLYLLSNLSSSIVHVLKHWWAKKAAWLHSSIKSKGDTEVDCVTSPLPSSHLAWEQGSKNLKYVARDSCPRPWTWQLLPWTIYHSY